MTPVDDHDRDATDPLVDDPMGWPDVAYAVAVLAFLAFVVLVCCGWPR